MPTEFIIDDDAQGSLHVKRHGENRISFKTSGECWASTADVRKLIRELDEMAAAIEMLEVA